jgi:SPP1 family predicted phage head-tail adaptor
VGINVGDLSLELTLQQPTGLDPDSGWLDVDTLWGSIRAVGQREQVRFGVPSAEGQSVITIRHRTDVQANWRLTDVSYSPARSFEILGYSDPNGEREQLDVLVVEKL